MRNIYTIGAIVLAVACASHFACGDTIAQQSTATTNDSSAIVHSELGERLDQYLSQLERFGMHGAILIERDGETILKNGYGLANVESEEPITAETVFHLGSIGKQFTASAIMLLQQQKKLNVNDTIDKYLENVPDDKKVITIHHLLTHTAGFPYHPTGGRVLDLPLQSKPGERWSYANPGYELLHDIIENLSGENYCDFMQENFFRPLGMNNTKCTGDPYREHPNLAVAYTDGSNQGTVVDMGRMPGFYGAGDFGSTVGDMLKWEHALRNNTILNAQSTTAMFTEHAKNDDSPMGYGYGWMTTTTIRGTRLIMHGGNLGGFNADYRRYIDENLTVIFLSNHFVNGRSMRDAVMNNVSLLINGGDAMKVPATVEADLAQLEGDYKIEGGVVIEADENGGALTLSSREQEGMYLLFSPQADDALRERCEQWSKDTVAVLTAIAEGDAEITRGLLDPALPFENAWPGVRGMVQNLEAEWGEFRSVDAHGTAPAANGQTGRCFAHVRFENGSVGMQITMTQNGLIHLTFADDPPAQRFLSTPGGDLVAFDIFSGANVTVGVKDDESANPVLVFHRGEERVEARKS